MGENGNMSKTIFVDTRLEAYQSFFDHAWAKQIMDLADGTKLDQPVFDLCAAWRGAANTHLLPWLLATQVQSATEMRVNSSKPFGKKWVSVVRDKLVAAMGDSLRHMHARSCRKNWISFLKRWMRSVKSRSLPMARRCGENCFRTPSFNLLFSAPNACAMQQFTTPTKTS